MAMELIRKVTTIAETQGVAQAAAELDRLARAQAGVAVASDTTAKSSLSAANAYDRLARAIDPVAREQARLERGQTVVNRALSEGAISSDQAARTLGILTERHLAAQRANDNLANSIRASGQATALNRVQMQTMVYTFNDVTASLASGISPMTILMQQGGQVTQAFGGVGATLRAMPAAVAAFVTPTVLGVGSIVGVLGGAAMAAAAYREQQDMLARSLNGVGRSAGVTADGLRQLGNLGAASAGITAGQGVEGAGLFAGAGLNGALMGPLLAQSKKYAQGTGQDLSDALKEMAGAFADPMKGADLLASRLGNLDGRTRETIRSLTAQGDIFGAQQALLGKFSEGVAELTTRTGALGKAWESVKGGASSAYQAVGGAIDRAVYGASPEQALKDAFSRREAIAKQAAEPNAFLGVLQRVPGGRAAEADAVGADIMKSWSAAMEEAARSIRAAAMAEAQKLSLAATDSVKTTLPEIGQKRELLDRRGLLEKALGDPAVLERMGVSADEAKQALANLTGQLTVWKSAADRMREDGRLEVAGIMARTFAERAAVDMHKAWTAAMSDGRGAIVAAIAAENERNKLIAEGNKAARDYARSASDELQLVGLNPYEQLKKKLELETKRFLEQSAPASGADVRPWEAPFAGGMSRLTSAADKATEALSKMAAASAGPAGAAPKALAALGPIPATSTTAGYNPQEVAEYIKTAASARGIDPTIALKVAMSEGLRSYVGDSNSSFGPFQLHYGGVAPGKLAVPGMGDDFTRVTGLDARDPATVKRQVDFSLDKALTGGWSPWYGAAKAGIGKWDGIGGAPVTSTAAASRAAADADTLKKFGLEQGQDKIRLSNEELDRQNALLAANSAAFGLSTAATAEASAKQQMLNQMMQQGVPITDQLRTGIAAYAARAGAAAKAAEEFADRQRDMIGAMDAVRGGAKDALSTFVSDLRQGKSAAEALRDAMNKLLDKIMSFAMDMMIDGLFGRSGRMGGGLFGGLFSEMFRGMFPGSGGGMGIPAPVYSSTGELLAGLFSQGGSIHAPAEYARVPVAAFAGAAHFASGGQIGGGIPIIGHPGEIIMNTMQQRNVADAIKASAAMAGMARTANDNRSGGGNVTVNVSNNHSGAKVETKETRKPNGDRQIDMRIVQAVLNDMDRGGPISQAMRQRAGR
jgi:phage-related minor tail protein